MTEVNTSRFIASASATAPPDSSLTSASPERSQNGGGLLAPPDAGTRASSADEDRDKNGANDGKPSTTVSGSSSVSGGNSHAGVSGGGGGQTMPAAFAPLSAKKGPQSFFSGSKIKHLKKADGIPLWRSDIQFEFLRAVFHNKDPVFTNAYTQGKGHSFADIYIDAMARSSKTSKILRDKLLSERENALNMAMVCLLVNVGRMNTTLNFFPEMKAQLRTYHAIPSLQAHTDSNAYKQLQDAPRLKSILKGACEDRQEPQTLEQIMEATLPRTNPINLVFVLSTYAPKVSETHFPDNMDFYDLVMRTTLSSKSRARAFLWLMWLYLESDFTEQECLGNPFGRGKYGRDKTKPMCVPEFEYLTEDQAQKENVDTEEEKAFGEAKQEERKRLLGELHNGPVSQGRGRGRKSLATAASPDTQSPDVSPGGSGGARFYHESDTRTRSASPESQFTTPAGGSKSGRARGANIVKLTNTINGENSMSPVETPKNKGGRPRNSAKRTYDGELKPLAQRIVLTKGGRPLSAPENQNAGRLQSMDRSSPALNNTGTRQRMTSHQLAVQKNRKDRVNHVIDRKMQRLDARKKRQRLKQGAFVRAWSRIKDIEDPLLLSDDEYPLKHTTEMVADDANINGDDGLHPNKRSKFVHRTTTYTRGPIGLTPRKDEELADDIDDFGEEAMSIAAAIRRTKRRLARWELVDTRHEFGDDATDADADGDEEVWDEEEGDAPAEAGAEQEEESDGDGDGDIDME